VNIVGYADNGDHTGTLAIDLNGDHVADANIAFFGDYAAGNFFTAPDGAPDPNGGTFIEERGPVISAETQTVTSDPNTHVTTISGLSVADAFDTAPDDVFSITAVAGQGTLAPHGQTGTSDTLSFSGTLSDINNALAEGVDYSPTLDGNNQPPAQDHVSLNIQDANGAIDEINFVFNVAGQPDGSGNINLNGTSGKDVIYNTSAGSNPGGTTDTMTGGAGSDTFVFRNFSPQTQHNDLVADFNLNQDFLNFDHTTFATISDVLAAAHADPNNAANTVITVDNHNTVTINNVTVADLTQHQNHILVV
jgi:hypothetical protein